MAIYTYKDFEREARNEGLYDSFSPADLKLAQSNPDAGMSLLQYKKDYRDATTDEAKAMANTGAEEVRSAYGNYTGGTTGSGYYIDSPSPSSFDAPQAPKYENNYADDISDLYHKQLDYEDFSYGDAPTYTNRYDDTIQDLISQMLNREDFSYDYSTDPLYSQYKKAYTREGKRATEDALGAAAAATGGDSILVCSDGSVASWGLLRIAADGQDTRALSIGI